MLPKIARLGGPGHLGVARIYDCATRVAHFTVIAMAHRTSTERQKGGGPIYGVARFMVIYFTFSFRVEVVRARRMV